MRDKLILILMFNVCFLLCPSCRYRIELPFNREKWQPENSSLVDNKNRPGMARNLVNQKLLIGKTREEVQELLGKPESLPEGIQNKLIYTTEENYGWDIDPVYTEWLEITFSQENKVENVEIKSQKMR